MTSESLILAMKIPLEVPDGIHSTITDQVPLVLNLESSVPIFSVAIQSTIALQQRPCTSAINSKCSASPSFLLQLLDVPSNVAILSRSPVYPGCGSSTLATYRWVRGIFEGQEARVGKRGEDWIVCNASGNNGHDGPKSMVKNGHDDNGTNGWCTHLFLPLLSLRLVISSLFSYCPANKLSPVQCSFAVMLLAACYLGGAFLHGEGSFPS
eukprot:scaffold84906_cov19-Tisochrysis_lutea.AAC.1